MKTFRAIALTLAVALLLSGCLYVDSKVPYDTDLDQTVLGEKVGEASVQSVLYLFAWGDAGVAAAAKNGGIKQVNHMDRKLFSVLFGLYNRSTTVVYGD